jgi:hypothetical protein
MGRAILTKFLQGEWTYSGGSCSCEGLRGVGGAGGPGGGGASVPDMPVQCSAYQVLQGKLTADSWGGRRVQPHGAVHAWVGRREE